MLRSLDRQYGRPRWSAEGQPVSSTRSIIRAIPVQDPAQPPAHAGNFANPQSCAVMAWNQYRIEVRGNVFTVKLKGTDTCKYTNTDPACGRFSGADPTFVGLQAYSNYSY